MIRPVDLVCSFTVPGTPVPKARARVFYDQTRRRYRAVTERRTSDAERRIVAHFWARYPRLQPLTGRVRMVLRFYVDHHRRVDADNLEKLCKDALNGRAYRDDSQIDATLVEVVRGAPDPRTEIEVWTLDAGVDRETA